MLIKGRKVPVVGLIVPIIAVIEFFGLRDLKDSDTPPFFFRVFWTFSFLLWPILLIAIASRYHLKTKRFLAFSIAALAIYLSPDFPFLGAPSLVLEVALDYFILLMTPTFIAILFFARGKHSQQKTTYGIGLWLVLVGTIGLDAGRYQSNFIETLSILMVIAGFAMMALGDFTKTTTAQTTILAN